MTQPAKSPTPVSGLCLTFNSVVLKIARKRRSANRLPGIVKSRRRDNDSQSRCALQVFHSERLVRRKDDGRDVGILGIRRGENIVVTLFNERRCLSSVRNRGRIRIVREKAEV